MKRKIYRCLLIALLASATMGCVRDTEVATQVTRTGKDWAEIESTQQYRSQDGKLVRERQLVKEKVKCVNKKGQRLPGCSPEECLEKQGTIVEEVETCETTSVK